MATATRRELTADTEIAEGATLGPVTRIVAPAGSTPGHVVQVAADGRSLELGDGGPAGLDLTGRAVGDVPYVTVDEDGAPALGWLAIPADWSSADYVLGIAGGVPVWRTATDTILDPAGLFPAPDLFPATDLYPEAAP